MDRHPDDPLAPYALYGELWSLSELERYDEVLERGRSFVDAHISDEAFDLQASEIQMKLEARPPARPLTVTLAPASAVTKLN